MDKIPDSVTVKVAASSSHNPPGSVALKVIVSLPIQFVSAMEMVAIPFTMLTYNSTFPVKVQTMSESALSTSLTYASRLIVVNSPPFAIV